MDNVLRQNNIVWTREFAFLLALALSYFYCLPLLRTGVVLGITASEMRIYDIVFAGLFIMCVLPRMNQLIPFWRNYSPAHRRLFAWLVLALIGLFITLINKETRFLIGAIRYFRFISFSLVFVVGFAFIRNRAQLWILYDFLLFAIVTIGLVGSLQALKLLPNFWPEYYSIYWDNLDGYMATAILAPNHTHYSLVMAIGIVMVVARLKIRPSFGLKSLYFLGGTIPMLYSMFASKGRSGWLVLGIYLAYMLVFSRSNRILILVLMAGVGAVAYSNLDVQAGNTTVKDILLYRSISTVKQTDRTIFEAIDDEEMNWIQKVDDSRWNIYVKSLTFLSENPEYLLIGAGFQNASQGIGKAAVNAHNAYINVVAEHGIIGLVIYLAFLYALFQFARKTRTLANTKESYFLATHWIGLFCGLLVANFFGEIIYPGRALFTFLGTFFIVAVLFLHPNWRNTQIRSNGTTDPSPSVPAS